MVNAIQDTRVSEPFLGNYRLNISFPQFGSSSSLIVTQKIVRLTISTKLDYYSHGLTKNHSNIVHVLKVDTFERRKYEYKAPQMSSAFVRRLSFSGYAAAANDAWRIAGVRYSTANTWLTLNASLIEIDFQRERAKAERARSRETPGQQFGPTGSSSQKMTNSGTLTLNQNHQPVLCFRIWF